MKTVLLYGKAARGHFIWALACSLCCISFSLWYLSEEHHGGSTATGLAAGIVASLIIVFEFLIWPRKAIRSVQRFGPIPLGSAKVWMRAHVWLGLLSLPLALLHSGFQLGGSFNATFMILFLTVIGSGVLGLALQNVVPKLMLRKLPGETVYSAIPDVSAHLADDAKALVRKACGARYMVDAEAELAPEPDMERVVVVGAIRDHGRLRGRILATQSNIPEVKQAERLQMAFLSQVHPYLLRGKRGYPPLASPDGAKSYFQELRAELGDDAASIVDSLASWCDQRRQFEAQAIYHWVLHGWLIVHVALSVAVLLFLFVHIWFALKYW